jgi:hypothetical protein
MTKSVHTQPAVAAGIGTAIGALAMAQAFFGSGHLPSSAEVAALLAGAGITTSSVVAFIYHHLKTIEAAVGDVPDVEAAVAKAVAALPKTPQIDPAALASQVKALIVKDAVNPDPTSSSTKEVQ